MRSHLVGSTIVIALVSLVGCDRGGDDCGKIKLGTPIAELDVNRGSGLMLLGYALEGPSDALVCCDPEQYHHPGHSCEPTETQCDCPGAYEPIDCSLPEHAPAEALVLSQDSWGEKCGIEGGQYLCYVWVREERVVATRQWCYD